MKEKKDGQADAAGPLKPLRERPSSPHDAPSWAIEEATLQTLGEQSVLLAELTHHPRLIAFLAGCEGGAAYFEIAEASGLTTTAVSRAVQRLSAASLVRRERVKEATDGAGGVPYCVVLDRSAVARHLRALADTFEPAAMVGQTWEDAT